MKRVLSKEIESALYGRRKNQRVEHGIQDAIVQWINLIPGFLVWRNNTGAVKFEDDKGKKRFVRFGRPGQGDVTGIGPHGVRVEVEVKRDQDATLSDNQEIFGQEMQQGNNILDNSQCLSENSRHGIRT